MTIRDAIESLKLLPAEKQVMVVKLIAMLSARTSGEERGPGRSWRGILKGTGQAPSLDEMREAREACWDLEKRETKQ